VVGFEARFIMIGEILGGRFALPRDAAMTKSEGRAGVCTVEIITRQRGGNSLATSIAAGQGLQ
jgi:hypothetical protein